MLTSLLNTLTQSPAFALVAIVAIVLIIAVICAKFTTPRSNDNGLIRTDSRWRTK